MARISFWRFAFDRATKGTCTYSGHWMVLTTRMPVTTLRANTTKKASTRNCKYRSTKSLTPIFVGRIELTVLPSAQTSPANSISLAHGTGSSNIASGNGANSSGDSGNNIAIGTNANASGLSGNNIAVGTSSFAAGVAGHNIAVGGNAIGTNGFNFAGGAGANASGFEGRNTATMLLMQAV
jgi:hypothetical protein